MAKQLVMKPLGLRTAVSPFEDVPEGALSRALNVMLKDSGVLEPRPGFSTVLGGLTLPGGTFKVVRAFPHDGDVLIAARDDGGNTRFDWLSDMTNVQDEQSTPADINWTPGEIPGADVGDIFVVNSDEGPRYLQAAGDSVLRPVGVGHGLIAEVGQPTEDRNPFNTGDKVAYSVVVKRVLGSNRTVLGPPSNVYREEFIFNGVSAFVRFIFPWWATPNSIAEGDIIQLYRTKTVTEGAPSAEMFLAQEVEITASDIATGSVVLTDSAFDDELSASMYTNETQGTVLATRYPPPHAKVIAPYKDMAVYANTKGVHRAVFELTVASSPFTDGGFGTSSTFSGTVGSSPDQVTGVSNVDGMEVGQYITDGTIPSSNGTRIAAETTITSITGSGPFTLGLSKAPVSTGATSSLKVHDALIVDGVAYFANNAGDSRNFETVDGDAYATMQNFSETIWRFAQPNFLARVIYQQPLGRTVHRTFYEAVNGNPFQRRVVGRTLIENEAGDIAQPRGLVVLERLSPTDGEFTVSSTRTSPGVFKPDIGTTPITSEQDLGPNVMWVSPPRIPDAAPPLNYVFVGDESPIRQVVQAGEALWIFKDDGLFRFIGTSFENSRLDKVDASLQLVHKDAVAVINDILVAWTNRGIVSLSGGGGIQELTQDTIQDQIDPAQKELLSASNPDATSGVWATYDPNRQLFFLGIQNTIGSAQADTVFVWSIQNGWVRWGFSSRHMAYDPAEARLLEFPSGAYAAREEIDVIGDDAVAVTINTVVDDHVTIAAGSGYSPAVGDLIIDSAATPYRITAVTNSVEFDVDTSLSSAPDTGAATTYQSFETDVEFIAKDMEDISVRKQYSRATWIFRDIGSITSYLGEPSAPQVDIPQRTSFKSDVTGSYTSEVPKNFDSPGKIGQQNLVAYVPRAVSRANVLHCRLKTTLVQNRWQLVGLAVEASAAHRTSR